MRTMKQLNSYLAKASNNRLKIYHGNGYFYYEQTDEEFKKNKHKDVPESEYICYINHLTTEKWKRYLDLAVEEYDLQD